MPFTLFYCEDLADYPTLGDQMLRDRGSQFKDTLGWDLITDELGRERDEYDNMNPLYTIVTDEEGQHIASSRVMPTTGQNMTSDHFSHLTGGVAVSSPKIWETTRFFVAQKDQRRAASALMWAGSRMALDSGVEFYLSITGAHLLRVFTVCGWRPEVIGRSGEGENEICACLWEVTPKVSARLARLAGIDPAEHDLRVHNPAPTRAMVRDGGAEHSVKAAA